MLYIYGTVFNLRKNDAMIDKKTGEITAQASFTVELLCQEKLANGELTTELLKVKIKDLNELNRYKPYQGKNILLHVGKMEGKRGKVGDDMVRGSDVYFARPDTYPIPFTMPDNSVSKAA